MLVVVGWVGGGVLVVDGSAAMTFSNTLVEIASTMSSNFCCWAGGAAAGLSAFLLVDLAVLGVDLPILKGVEKMTAEIYNLIEHILYKPK